MKKKLKVFIAGLISMSLLVGCATDKLGKTVATVNGENITYGEYLKKFAFKNI